MRLVTNNELSTISGGRDMEGQGSTFQTTPFNHPLAVDGGISTIRVNDFSDILNRPVDVAPATPVVNPFTGKEMCPAEYTPTDITVKVTGSSSNVGISYDSQTGIKSTTGINSENYEANYKYK